MPDAAPTPTPQPNGATPPPNVIEQAPTPQLPGTAPAVVPDWAKDYDDESKALIAKKNWKTPVEVTRGYANLERLARDNTRAVLIPDTATPEAERDDFYRKLGWPEKDSDYQFKAPQEAQDYSTEQADWWRKTAHKLRIPKDLAEAIHDDFVGNFLEKARAASDTDAIMRRDWDAELHKEYGGAYDSRVEIARRAVRTFGDDALIKVLNDSGLGDHPAVVRAFVKMGMKLGEQNLVVGDEQHGALMTPAEAQEKISQIRRDPKHPYNIPGAPDHAHAQAQMRKLYEAAYPGEENRRDVRK